MTLTGGTSAEANEAARAAVAHLGADQLRLANTGACGRAEQTAPGNT